MKIEVYDNSLNYIDDINSTTTAERFERMIGENIFNFQVPLTNKINNLINGDRIVKLQDDFFDIMMYEKSQSGNQLAVNVECEHVSYRLNNPEYDITYFTRIGTPETILGHILDGTEFAIGTIEFSESITFSAQEEMTRRQLLIEFAEYLGGDLIFTGFTVSIVRHRGSQEPKDLLVGKNINILSKTWNKREKDENGNPKINYVCSLKKPMNIEIGDVVTIDYDRLSINTQLRVLSKRYDPNKGLDVEFEVGNFQSALEDEMYRIQTSTVGKGKFLNGNKISPENGFESFRLDNYQKTQMAGTDGFKMWLGDGSGNQWEAVFYVKIVDGVPRLFLGGNAEFQGLIEASQFIGGSIIITKDNKIERYMIDESQGLRFQRRDSEEDEWEDAIWMQDGNAGFTGTITGSIITGGVIRTADPPNRRVEVADNQIRTFNDGNVRNGFSTNDEAGGNFGDVHFYDDGKLVFSIFNVTAGGGVSLIPRNGAALGIGANDHKTLMRGDVGGIFWRGTEELFESRKALGKFVDRQIIEITDHSFDLGEDLPTDLTTITATDLNATNLKINMILGMLREMRVIDE